MLLYNTMFFEIVSFVQSNFPEFIDDNDIIIARLTAVGRNL